MRKVCLSREDFELFHQDITPQTFEFFRTHSGAFKRMWQEQTRRFWSMFVSTFEYFIWNYGVMKDFPMKAEEIHDYVDEIIFYIRDQFVDGKASTAKSLVMDCVIVTQNRHCIALLDKTSYAQNPFYMKETREIFRQLFGPPNSKRTFMKVLCGLPVYIKFAGAAVMMIRRWLEATDIPSDDEEARSNYFDHIHVKVFRPGSFDPYLALGFTSKPKVPALEAPPKTKKDLEKTSAASSSKKDKKGGSDAKTKKSSAAKDSSSEKAKPKESLPEKTKVDSEQSKLDSGKAGLDAGEAKLDSEKGKLDETKGGEEGTVEDMGAGQQGGEEQFQDGGATTTKKKRRRRKKKRGCAASDSVEDGLGLDEDLPSLVAEEVVREEEEGKGEVREEEVVLVQSSGVEEGVKEEVEEVVMVRDPVVKEEGEGLPQDIDSDRKHDVSEMEEISPVAPTVTKEEELVVKKELVAMEEQNGSDVIGGEDVSVKENEDLVAKGEDVVAKEEDVVEELVAKESCDRDDDQGKRERRLHICACCGLAETIAKSFKRCQKCRGKLNPCYYCSRECQAKHWKTHKLDHKN